ncbi:MAG: transcription-repair coupling factor [bacterium]
MIETIQKQIFSTEQFQKLRAAATGHTTTEPIQITGVNGSLMAFLAAFQFHERHSQVVLVVSDDNKSEQLRDDCALLCGDSAVRLYAHGSEHKAALLDMTAPVSQIETLKALTNNSQVIVICSAEALVRQIPLPKEFIARSIELETGKDYPFETVLQTLATWSFERKDFVEEYGDYAVRGGILDIFPYVGENPIRIEFWGDSIESIREFDVLSQRSIRELQSVSIVASLASSSPDQESGSTTHPPHSTASLFDYLKPNALVIIDEPLLIQKEIDELFHEGLQHIHDWRHLEQESKRFQIIAHSTFNSQSATIDFRSTPQPPVHGTIKLLLHHLSRYTADGCSSWIACDSEDEAKRIQELIEEELTTPDAPQPGEESHSAIQQLPIIDYSILQETFHSGFVYPPANLVLLTEHEIFGRLKRRGTARKKRFKGFSLKEAHQLQRGDYVVHVDHGIGKFTGLQKLKIHGVEQEVMRVNYAENDVLYVNLNFVNRVQKYASQEGHVPKLSKLGAPDWDRLKSKARKHIQDIARDLIALYARRKLEQGYAFAPDTHWQKEMEASFMYEDTPDQAKATIDVKLDMEQLSPMDRLICGDVGFGKTEVAVRAAFKAVMSGKQAGILVPTTILAQQHYNTFIDRLGRYSVRVESLSRFKSKSEQKAILAGLNDGKVDILIGTHRLLSKDVEFKNFGLLIIDEEHRFGVSAKEKLRRLRATVDTMTLTATPIPRTLQFSLMGARDLSIINTPPRNRLPIITEIAQFEFPLVREAILKELHRGGQIYFIHDRIHDIEEWQTVLSLRIPEARFHVAHGQMKGHELEKAMMDFLEKKFDVLLCTKIIESGIDIPSVNTIIINRADRFGLAELYQLRGRVGRSNEQAYAYLLTPPLSSLPRQTLRRLSAIQEFTELGSGFNLAMRDLEIRGAGNLLGAEQSGFILEMGFEMYQRIVEEAVAELKEKEFAGTFEGEAGDGRRETVEGKREKETIIEANIEGYIPDLYIESDAERLDFYRRLYRVHTLEDVQSMREELRDRFGEYPEEVENLFGIVELKTIAAKLGFIKVELQQDQLKLHFPPSETKEFYERWDGTTAPFQAIMAKVTELKQYRAHLKQDGKQLKLVARIKPSEKPAERLGDAKYFLTMLLATLSETITH